MQITNMKMQIANYFTLVSVMLVGVGLIVIDFFCVRCGILDVVIVVTRNELE